jgi:hypothetical protein
MDVFQPIAREDMVALGDPEMWFQDAMERMRGLPGSPKDSHMTDAQIFEESIKLKNTIDCFEEIGMCLPSQRPRSLRPPR